MMIMIMGGALMSICVCVSLSVYVCCLTPRCNIALMTAQQSITNSYISPSSGVPQLPFARSTLGKRHTIDYQHNTRKGLF